jgi:hypothetical protein
MILIMSANFVTVTILQLPSEVRNVPQFKYNKINLKISISLSC